MLNTKLTTLNVLTIGISLSLLPLSSPSASAQVLNGTTLTVNGSAAANTVRFSIDGDEVVTLVDGAESRFDLAQVDELSVFANAGDDTVINNTHIKMSASGGGGDDYIVGGSGDDVLLGQAGEDSLFGRDGQDELDGGPGTDYLAGGNGDDNLVSTGNVGNRVVDVMFGGAGDDLMTNGLEMSGGPGNDQLIVNLNDADRDDVVLSGGPGNDHLSGPSSPRTTSIGGPGVDVINGRLRDFGVSSLSQFGRVYAGGGATDDTLTMTLEAGQLVVRVENSNTATQEIFDPAEVVWVQLSGVEGDDVLVNSSETEARLEGGPGDDLSMTNTDLDSCFNDAGNDVYVLHGGRVAHQIRSGNFNAITVIGSERNEEVNLISFVTATGVSQIDLGAGDDHYDGFFNHGAPVTVRGGAGDDILEGGRADDNEKLFGDSGNDIIEGFGGDQSLFGGGGDDMLLANSHNARDGLSFLFGGPGADTLTGSDGPDRIYGGTGNDMLVGGDADDLLRGEGGNDVMEGGAGNDLMFGGVGNDELFGGVGNDRLNGQGGIDLLDGGSGNNVLNQ